MDISTWKDNRASAIAKVEKLVVTFTLNAIEQQWRSKFSHFISILMLSSKSNDFSPQPRVHDIPWISSTVPEQENQPFPNHFICTTIPYVLSNGISPHILSMVPHKPNPY